MRSRQNQAPISNFGIASLLTIFIVLCLVVFAALSLSTAKNDYNHSDSFATHKAAYYEASNESERIVQIIAQHSDAGAEKINRLIRKQNMDIEVTIDDGIASWSAAISDSQELYVELDIESMKIKSWSEVSTES